MSEQKELAVQSNEVISMIAEDLVNTIGESFAFGHAWLWVNYKVGNKSYRCIAAYSAISNWSDITSKLKWACPEITSTRISFD